MTSHNVLMTILCIAYYVALWVIISQGPDGKG